MSSSDSGVENSKTRSRPTFRSPKRILVSALDRVNRPFDPVLFLRLQALQEPLQHSAGTIHKTCALPPNSECGRQSRPHGPSVRPGRNADKLSFRFAQIGAEDNHKSPSGSPLLSEDW